MNLKRSRARLSQEGSIEQAARAISTDGLPNSLRGWRRSVGDALAKAKLPAIAQHKVLAHALALYTALGKAPPPPSRDYKRSLESLKRASARILELPTDVDDVLRNVIEVEPSPEGYPTFELVDPMAKIRCSLKAALPGARRQTRSHGASGRRISPTTTAVYALVDFVIEIEPSIKRPALTEFVATVLALALESFNRKTGRGVREPRWVERVGEALADRKRMKA